ncbi:MAG: HEPN domain-containing protein [Candidatus Bathyarchaeia archaeon]
MAEKIGAGDYMEAAKEKLGAARREQDVGLYSGAVLNACLAVDNAVNAFLLAIGARPAKRHRWTLAVMNAAKSRKPELLRAKTFREVLELVKELEAGAHMIRSRYPFTFGGKKLIPEEYYTIEVAGEVLGKAEEILAKITKLIEKWESTNSLLR